MDCLKIYLNYLEILIIHPKSGLISSVKHVCGHLFISGIQSFLALSQPLSFNSCTVVLDTHL